MENKNQDLELFDELEFMNNFSDFQTVLNKKSEEGIEDLIEFEKLLNQENLKHAKKTKNIQTLKYKKAKK